MGCCVSACGPQCAYDCGCSNVEAVDFADPGDGLTQLHIACFEGDLPFISQLLDNGHTKSLQMHTTGENKYYPLHHFCRHLWYEELVKPAAALNAELPRVVELLRRFEDCGADFNATTASGDTPLNLLFREQFSFLDERKFEIAKTLLECGCDPAIANNSLESPFSKIHTYINPHFAMNPNVGNPGSLLYLTVKLHDLILAKYGDNLPESDRAGYRARKNKQNQNDNDNNPDGGNNSGHHKNKKKKHPQQPYSMSSEPAFVPPPTTLLLQGEAKTHFVTYVVKSAVRMCEREDNIITAEQAKVMRAQLEEELAHGIDYSEHLRDHAEEQLIEFMRKKIKILHDDGALEKNELKDVVKRFVNRFDEQLREALEKKRAATVSTANSNAAGIVSRPPTSSIKKDDEDNHAIVDAATGLVKDVASDFVKDTAKDVASDVLSFFF